MGGLALDDSQTLAKPPPQVLCQKLLPRQRHSQIQSAAWNSCCCFLISAVHKQDATRVYTDRMHFPVTTEDGSQSLADWYTC